MERFDITAMRLPRLPKSRLGLASAGIAASIALHALLLVPLVWGSGGHRVPMPNSQGASASHSRSDESESMLVVFINESQSVSTEDGPVLPTSVSDSPVKKITIPDLSRFVRIDTRFDNSPLEADGDQNGHALMFGRYMGQISARIQRVWRRPRSSIGAPSFACRVQIAQDRAGRVQEVALQECNGSVPWQASLVRAIEGASPLPAPPESAVFSNLVTLEFDSDPFAVDVAQDGFEPATTNTSQSRPLSELELTEIRGLRGVKSDNQRDVVKLTITGSSSR
jgi:hypothetical protein